MHFSPVTQVQQRQSVQTTSLQAPSWQGLVTWRQRQTQKRDKGCWYATLFGVPSYMVWWADLRTAESTQGTLVWELHWLSHSHWVNVPTWGWRGIEVGGSNNWCIISTSRTVGLWTTPSYLCFHHGAIRMGYRFSTNKPKKLIHATSKMIVWN